MHGTSVGPWTTGIVGGVTGRLVALVISSPKLAGQLVAKTRRQNNKVTSFHLTSIMAVGKPRIM